MRHQLPVSVVLAVAFSVAGLGAQGPAFPVRLSADGTHLVDQSERPFFMNGEAAWSLIGAVSKEDAELYLENRRQKTFNVVMVSLIEHTFSANHPANYYNQAPFTTPGNFTTPNESYFAHADWVISKAAEKGIVVLLAPIYLGYQCGNEGWCSEVRSNSSANMRTYGRYLGSRYRNFPNIIWLIGGDTDPVAAGVAGKVQEVVAGIKEYDSVHLMSAHNAPEQSAVDPWPTADWLNLNNIYTYSNTYPKALEAFNRSPFKPFFLSETYYENEHNSTPFTLRRQAYWTVLSGGLLGHVFGNCQIWGFSYGFCSTSWKGQLESAGSQTVANVGRLFRSRPFQKLVPDQTHRVLTTGFQSGDSLASTARASDGSFAISYIPTSRMVTIDVSQIGGGAVRAWWFNPSTAASALIGEFPATGSRQFTPPDQNDWILVVDNAALNFPAPGGGATSVTAPAAPTNVRVIR
jgi:hypothetical protein